MSKIHANRGVRRNKKPLKNLVYVFTIHPTLKDNVDLEKYEQYKFKDQGYLTLSWYYQGANMKNSHGFITPDNVKELIGVKQWAKFCEGKREFILQRRIDGKNT